MATIIENIRTYLFTCPALTTLKDIGIDYLGATPPSYSIDSVPTSTIKQRFTDGSSVRELLFVFAIRHPYGVDTIQNLTNLNFFDNLQSWIEEQNDNENYPEVSENQTVQKIEVMTTGYPMQTDTKSARYQVQMKLTYTQTN